jgi:hypothetical protein
MSMQFCNIQNLCSDNNCKYGKFCSQLHILFNELKNNCKSNKQEFHYNITSFYIEFIKNNNITHFNIDIFDKIKKEYIILEILSNYYEYIPTYLKIILEKDNNINYDNIDIILKKGMIMKYLHFINHSENINKIKYLIQCFSKFTINQLNTIMQFFENTFSKSSIELNNNIETYCLKNKYIFKKHDIYIITKEKYNILLAKFIENDLNILFYNDEGLFNEYLKFIISEFYDETYQYVNLNKLSKLCISNDIPISSPTNAYILDTSLLSPLNSPIYTSTFSNNLLFINIPSTPNTPISPGSPCFSHTPSQFNTFIQSKC